VAADGVSGLLSVEEFDEWVCMRVDDTFTSLQVIVVFPPDALVTKVDDSWRLTPSNGPSRDVRPGTEVSFGGRHVRAATTEYEYGECEGDDAFLTGIGG